MLAALTGTGLAAAAGLNAYIPYLIVALIAKFTDIITLPAEFAWIESWWSIGIGSVLLLAEVVLDKVPAVDSVNDAIQTFIRPGIGGLIFVAVQSAEQVESSTFLGDHPWIGAASGIVIAGTVHTAKAVVRPVVNVGTAGFGAPVVSTVEDTGAIGLSLVALFLPVLVVFVLALLVWLFVVLWLRLRRRRRAATARAAAPPGWPQQPW